jgi:hypothetical protein
MWSRVCQAKFVRVIILSLLFSCTLSLQIPTVTQKVKAQTSLIPVLFDNTKAETAGNADWIIDTDQPTPSPANPTSETSWVGAISAWGVELVKTGKYTVSSLPSNGRITYGDATNSQDLSKYKIFVIPEPNTAFTAAEKTAIINFVDNGGGLFMIADHLNSDRNNDGIDSPRIFNDLMNNNSRGISNIFGIQYDLNNISSENPSKLNTDPNDPIIFGAYGVVAGTILRAGASMTINTSSNANVRGVIFRNTFSNTGSTGVAFARSQFGQGRITAHGDSSAIDDGTGQPSNNLFDGWNDPAGTNKQLFLNATEWLANTNVQPTFTLSASPTSQTVNAGSSTSYSVTTAAQGGFSGMVTLSISGLPAGATSSFSANPIVAGSGSTLTVNTSSTTTGTSNLTITATGNGVTKTTNLSLTVNSNVTPNYSLSLSPNSKSIAQGTSGTLTVTTTPTGGFSSPITLTASSLPSGVTASFSPNPVTPGSSSTLTLTASSAATTGTLTININGVASPLSRSTPLSLTVTPGVVERLVNGGFEGSTSPWVLSGSAFYTTSGAYPHGGTGYVNTGNTNNSTGIIYQQFTIPSTATTANLTFWLNASSTETSTTRAYDFLYVEIYSSSGALLQTLATYSNLDKSPDGVYNQKGGFSLLSYKGQTIRVRFRGVNGSIAPTIFRIDDVSVK